MIVRTLESIEPLGRTATVIFQRLPGPIKFRTARAMMCDLFNVVDAHADDICLWILDNGYARNDGGWLVML